MEISSSPLDSCFDSACFFSLLLSVRGGCLYCCRTLPEAKTPLPFRARDLTDSVDPHERRLDSIDCRLARPRKSLEFTWGSSNCIQTYQLRRVPSDSTLLCQREANSGGLLPRPSPECTGPAALRHPAADYIFMFPEGRPYSRFDAPRGAVPISSEHSSQHLTAHVQQFPKVPSAWVKHTSQNHGFALCSRHIRARVWADFNSLHHVHTSW